MKKTYQVKRTLVQTPKGVKAYYFQDGKRISDKKGRLKYIKQNYQRIDQPYSKYPVNLTANEIKTFKQSKGQRDLYRYKGKPIDRFMVELLKAKNIIRWDDPERNLLNLTTEEGQRIFSNFGQFEQIFNLAKEDVFNTFADSLMGAEGHRGRTKIESAISLAERLTMVGRDGWQLEVIRNGQPFYGLEAGMEQIRIFEEEITKNRSDKNSNVAAVRFTYDLEWDADNKIIQIILEELKKPRKGTKKGEKKRGVTITELYSY